MFRKLLRLLFGERPSPSVEEVTAPAPLPQAVEDLLAEDFDTLLEESPAVSQPRDERASAVAEKPRRTRAEIQAASVARKAARRQAAAERHANDIQFLGRGVSRGLEDRESNVARLEEAGLPVLATPADVATALRISIPQLRWLAWHSETITRSHYYSFQIPKKSGGLRTLQAPHRTLAAVQGWILDEVLCHIPVHSAAHGFVPQRSVVTNARPHVGARVVINVDLNDFFPSITFARVNGLFRSLGYSSAVATILALLCTEAPRDKHQHDGIGYLEASGPRALPQGACTSPAISNLITRSLDRRLQGLADRLGWTYTRYADDITWSAQAEPSPSVGYVLARLRHITEEEGFQLNPGKTRVQRPGQRQSVTGVTVNDQLSIPRTTIRRVRAILHNAQFTGLEAQNRDSHPHFEDWLQGLIGWIRMVQPETGDKLRAAFDQVRKQQSH